MAKSDFRKFLNLLGFIGVILVGAALVVAKIAGGGALTSAMTLVANFIAYFITAVAAFYYVRARNKVWMYVVYFVAIIVIAIFMFL